MSSEQESVYPIPLVSDSPRRRQVLEPGTDFDAFWAAYPRKVSKQNARRAWVRAVKATKPEVITSGAARYAAEKAGSDPHFIAHPHSWLQGCRWEDAPPSAPVVPQASPSEARISPARPTIYRGTRMRSRLEALFAAWLDNHDGGYGGQWRYEPICFAGPDGQWLPDFGYEEDGLRSLYLEVKPSSQQRIDLVLVQMEVAWESDPDALLGLHVVDSDDPSDLKITLWYGRDGAWKPTPRVDPEAIFASIQADRDR